MTNSAGPTREGRPERWGKSHGRGLPDGWFLRGGWKHVDPLYLWSAAVGLFLAVALIVVAQVIRTGRLH
jgi:hypothetical protein